MNHRHNVIDTQARDMCVDRLRFSEKCLIELSFSQRYMMSQIKGQESAGLQTYRMHRVVQHRLAQSLSSSREQERG